MLTERATYWFLTSPKATVLARCLRKEGSNEAALVCPCLDTINLLVSKKSQYDYYLTRIWEDGIND